MKKILHISIWLILLTGIILLLSFATNGQKDVVCSSVNISFTDHSAKGFISLEDIEKMTINCSDSLVGQLLDSINTSEISRTLAQNPYIKNVAVFKAVNGEIQIEVDRHLPLVRVINKKNESYYLSENGSVLPFSKQFTPFVMVSTGNITEDYKTIKTLTYDNQGENAQHESILSSIHYLSKILYQHEHLHNFVEQIYVNQQGELELVPADGKQYIILGDVNLLHKKLNNLMALYRDGNLLNQDDYKSINLSITNQIVCKK